MSEFVTVNHRVYHIRKKTEGIYHVRLTVGRHWKTGQQIQHDYTGRDAAEIQKKVDDSRQLSDEQLKLVREDKQLAAVYDEYRAFRRLCASERVIVADEVNFKHCLNPFFQGRTIRSINEEELWEWKLKQQEQGRTGKYIEDGFCLMNRIMEFGCRRGYLAYNPCRYVEHMPRIAQDQSILNSTQIRKLLTEVPDRPMTSLLAVTLMLGLRGGEACGLSWKQIDWERGTVCISQQGNLQREIVPHTKTRRNRTLLMPRCAQLFLLRERNRQQRLAEENKNFSNPDGLVFLNKRGRGYNNTKVNRALDTIMKQKKDEIKVSPHSLRRTAASLIAEALNLHAAQYYLGHTSGFTTMGYVYPRAEDTMRLVETMGDYFDRLLWAADRKNEQTTAGQGESDTGEDEICCL